MHIQGPSYVHGAHALGGPHRAARAVADQPAASGRSISDEIQISDAGQFLAEVKQAPDIRADRVAAIQAQIASGAYETSDKFDLAVERLLDEIA